MSRYIGPKSRLCRREGVCLCGREKCPVRTKKNYFPGMHGQKGSISKPSEYARQLREKQKLKRLFGVTERQLQNYFDEAAKKKEITGHALLKILETRFDNVVYRAGFAKTRAQARQMVNHGLMNLNGRKVNIASHQVKPGDKFEVVNRAKKSKLFADLENQKFAPASWVKADYKNLNGEMVRPLEIDDLEQIIQHNLVVEYFSK
jgi:small subunit ribosomal protein S4